MITLLKDKLVIEIPCDGAEIKNDFKNGDKKILKAFWVKYFSEIAEAWVDETIKEAT